MNRNLYPTVVLGLLLSSCLAAQDLRTGGPLAGLADGRTPGSPEKWAAYFGYARPMFDRQSELRRWDAAELAGAVRRLEQVDVRPASNPSFSLKNTGETAPVVRFAAGQPAAPLDFEALDEGLYVVRVIATVRQSLRPWRLPVFVTLRVNDQLDGGVTTHRVRASYNDDFYSVAEIFFHAPQRRAYRGELSVDEGSMNELLVHAVTLDDVLAGCQRRAVKTRATLQAADTAMAAAQPAASSAERLERDRAIWRALPPLNVRPAYANYDPAGIPDTTIGVGDRTAREIAEEHGVWERVACGIQGPEYAARFTPDPRLYNAFLVNKKLDCVYTVDQLWDRQPLPDPYPYKDDGAGLYTPDPDKPGAGRIFTPIGSEIQERLRAFPWLASNGLNRWQSLRDEQALRDGAVALVRYAYQFPAIDTSHVLYFGVRDPGPMRRDNALRQRMTTAYWMAHYEDYLHTLRTYDEMFGYLQGNEELARSIGRFVPWVKTSEDLIQLLDVYLVQTTAKRILRYHYSDIPGAIATCAAVLGDREVTSPWLEWLFSQEYFYPLPKAGIQDVIITGTDRYGAEYTGASFYAGEGALTMANSLQPYLNAGGDPRYDLTTFTQKPLDHARWHLQAIIGGADLARIGDVSGPDKPPGRTLDSLGGIARRGWQWSGDPQFAWILKHRAGRREESDAEWARIERAAAKLQRAPWLDLKSRYVDNWFGVLESGRPDDDPRQRAAVYLRTGLGQGHNHWDTLDLQLFAHGLPMTIDGGQRSGYSKPNDRFTRTHNTVEVRGAAADEFGVQTYAWIRSLCDAPGARYMLANTLPPTGTQLYQRQTALIDLDGITRRVPSDGAGPVATDHYVFDVFRVSGGRIHSYGFHGPVSDLFSCNAEGVQPVPHVAVTYDDATDAKFLSIFERSADAEFAGDAPNVVDAVWRYQRTGVGSEQQMLGANFDPAAPQPSLRLRLFDTHGDRVLWADVICSQPSIPYRFTQLMVQRRGDDLESAFPALIEPCAGSNSIVRSALVAVSDNEADARRAVAVEVETIDGRRDLCFADGRPDRPRELRTSSGSIRVAGEFAFLSTDALGLRAATLGGGTELITPQLRIQVSQRERNAQVVAADYAQRTLTIDQRWPSLLDRRLFEVGTSGHKTAYTAVSIVDVPQGSQITVSEGADLLRARIESVDPGRGQVSATLPVPIRKRGTTHWVASNEAQTRFWRASTAGAFLALEGDPVRVADFEPQGVLRLWEYGVGDTVRQNTWISLRRISAQQYVLAGDVDCQIRVGDKDFRITVDDLLRHGGEFRLQID